MFHADGKTDTHTHTHMTKLIVAFSNFVKAPKFMLMRSEIGTLVEHRIYDDTKYLCTIES